MLAHIFLHLKLVSLVSPPFCFLFTHYQRSCPAADCDHNTVNVCLFVVINAKDSGLV